jgi:glucokinase
MYIAIDLGGTNTRIASSVDLKSISCVVKFPTSQNFDIELGMISSGLATVTTKNFTKDYNIRAVAMGVPGVVDFATNKFVKMPHYQNLTGKSVASLLPPSLKNVNMVSVNDAALAGYAEALQGAGSKYKSVAYITLSTGVGGVLIKNKSASSLFSHFEPGHIIIAEDGRVNTGCGQRGCFEAYASGTSFKQIYGVAPENCNDTRIWAKYAKHLADGLVTVATLWQPDVIVLGGKLATKMPLFYKPLIAEMQKQSFVYLPDVVQSKFGDDSGLLGGFLLLDTLKKTS